jgi:hypothetical protein
MSAKYFNSNLGDAPLELPPVWRETPVNSIQCKGRRKSMDMCVTKLKMLENISGLFFLYFGGNTEPA